MTEGLIVIYLILFFFFNIFLNVHFTKKIRKIMQEKLLLDDKRDESFCIKDTEKNIAVISNSVDCFFYFLKEFQTIEINNVNNSTVFIAKSAEIRVSNCEGLKLTCYSEKIDISKAIQSTFYLYISNNAFIHGQSNVTIAPYNACFNSDVLVPNGDNLWEKPNVEEGSIFAIMEPTEFIPFVIPYGEEPKGILAPLPSSYTRSLQWREKVAEERRQLILQFCKRAPSYAKELQEKIYSAFRERVLEDKEEGRQMKQLSKTVFM